MKRLLFYSFIFRIVYRMPQQKTQSDASGTFEADEVIVSAELVGKILSFNIEE